MSERNKALVRDMVESVLNQRDIAALDGFVAEEYAELDPTPGQKPGRDGLKQLLSAALAAFPDLQFTILERVAEGDTVVSRFRYIGTHLGDFDGVSATGGHVSVKGVVINRVIDGLLADGRILEDRLALMRQLGVVPSGPS